VRKISNYADIGRRTEQMFRGTDSNKYFLAIARWFACFHLNMSGINSIIYSSLWQPDIDLLFKCLWQETGILFIAPSIGEFSQNKTENCIKIKQFREEKTKPTFPLHMVLLLLLLLLLYRPMQGMYNYMPEINLFLRYNNYIIIIIIIIIVFIPTN
jgi:hypothetical protein